VEINFVALLIGLMDKLKDEVKVISGKLGNEEKMMERKELIRKN
jgi:hypothetical protein